MMLIFDTLHSINVCLFFLQVVILRSSLQLRL